MLPPTPCLPSSSSDYGASRTRCSSLSEAVVSAWMASTCTVQHSAVQTVQYSTVQYSTVTVLCCTSVRRGGAAKAVAAISAFAEPPCSRPVREAEGQAEVRASCASNADGILRWRAPMSWRRRTPKQTSFSSPSDKEPRGTPWGCTRHTRCTGQPSDLDSGRELQHAPALCCSLAVIRKWKMALRCMREGWRCDPLQRLKAPQVCAVARGLAVLTGAEQLAAAAVVGQAC